MKSPQGTSSTATVRGTQSFVGVMAEVWKRPSVTAIEVAWRWSFWVLFLGFVAAHWWPSIQPFALAVQANGLSGDTLSRAASIFVGSQRHVGLLGRISLPLAGAAVFWMALSAWGRGKVLLRLRAAGSASFARLFLLSAVRVLSFLLVLAFWFRAVVWLAKRMIQLPKAQYREPAWVPFAAAVICGTLALFVLWMAFSYVFQITPVVSVYRQCGFWDCIKLACGKGALRGKLIEVNLVIGIAKIALLVLAMVFSACPLPFSSVETQGFLTCWWIGVGIWYALASDFVHVVRTAAFLRLWEVYEIPELASSHSSGN